MNIDEMARAVQVFDQSAAAPEMKARMHDLVTTIISRNASAEHSERRAERWLKYSLGWAILVAFVLLFVTAFGHAVGLWAIAKPDQLPWIWGSSLGLGVAGPQYLLRVFFPKSAAPK